MQYMISPLDLSQRQLLIYKVLYDKCDFNTMQVSITIENIKIAINVADFNYSAIYRDINKMIKKGYIEIVRKAGKGVAPAYRLVKINELKVKTKCKPNENQVQTKTEQFQCIEGYKEYQVQTKKYQVTTNSKDKDKDIYIYSRVIDYLNEKASKSFKYTTKKTKSCIDARLREGFTEADFLKVIDIKTKHWKDNSNMNMYLRPTTLFGTKFESYLQESNYNDKEKQKNKEVNFDDIQILDNENNRIDI